MAIIFKRFYLKYTHKTVQYFDREPSVNPLWELKLLKGASPLSSESVFPRNRELEGRNSGGLRKQESCKNAYYRNKTSVHKSTLGINA